VEKIEFYFKQMLRIRKFEELLLSLFAKGLLNGTTHTCLGQEANAVGVCANLNKQDIVFSGHRCHGHYLAHSGSLRRLLSEIMGLPDGVCSGKGGSQHICNGRFFSSGIQGGFLPVTLGMAFSQKRLATRNIVVAFIGDGTLGQGNFYETLNMASIYKVPLLVVLENNGIAQTTDSKLTLAGDIRARGEAFDIETYHFGTTDVAALDVGFKEIIYRVREKSEPALAIIDTVRLGPHSARDDTRSKSEIDQLKKKDPLDVLISKYDGNYSDWATDIGFELDGIKKELGIQSET
jgi:TPP-dependent pyruvate/acetoin dehydrogenase alpha subunit